MRGCRVSLPRRVCLSLIGGLRWARSSWFLLLIGALDDLAVPPRLGLLPERRPRAGGDHPAHPAADGAYLTLALRELRGQNALTPSVNAPSQVGPTPRAAPLLRQTRKGWTKTR